jgi:hypothetical protein
VSSWDEFESAAPTLARHGRERFEATHVALLGTLRRDGSPRISPVEPYFVRGQLVFGVMRSRKGADLARDPRCTLHSAVTDPQGSEGEFKLFGRAAEVVDKEVRDAADGWWKEYPEGASVVYSMDVESASFVEWDWEKSQKRVLSWSVGSTEREVVAGYP